MKIKAIITGTTGMVGEGVLHECLNHPDVESVLVINRRSCNVQHPKLKEIIHTDFYNLTKIEDQLSGFNACFFCLGTTSVGKSEEVYTHITFDLTKAFADTLLKLNPDMTFCYVSGSGTDSTEKGKIMWARIKGRTENYLIKIFDKAYMFRPALIGPTKGLKNTLTPYKILSTIDTIGKITFSKVCMHFKRDWICDDKYCNRRDMNKEVLEVEDIKTLAYK